MEVHPGVFVSNVHTDDWIPDTEVGGETHVLVQGPDAFVGMSRYQVTPESVSWTLPGRETLLVLEGAARIEILGGPTLDLQVGDMASLPKGVATTWHITAPFREIWFLPRASDTEPT